MADVIEHVKLGRRWESSEISAVEGPLELRAWRGASDPSVWYANANMWVQLPDDKMLHAGHGLEEPSIVFPSYQAAIAALNAWADALGPVEPVLAMLAFWRFERREIGERWAHREVVWAAARRTDMRALAYDAGVEREGRAA